MRADFQVKESRLALIPKTGNQEVLSYEFRGNYLGEDYLLYLNAINGNEEKILRLWEETAASAGLSAAQIYPLKITSQGLKVESRE